MRNRNNSTATLMNRANTGFMTRVQASNLSRRRSMGGQGG